MDIGNKLHRARTNANLTQEQVAEALGVSRQTISNWENEKTYPDIRSVVTLSDLYNVSLDHLLKDKEDNKMTTYLEYLEESTNVVKSKTNFSKLILVITYLLIWASSLIVFWFFTEDSDAMGYSLMFLIILLPVTTYAISMIIGLNNLFGKWKWLTPIILGIMYVLLDYATFSAANMTAFNKLNAPTLEAFPMIALISLFGLSIGSLNYYIQAKRNEKKSN